MIKRCGAKQPWSSKICWSGTPEYPPCTRLVFGPWSARTLTWNTQVAARSRQVSDVNCEIHTCANNILKLKYAELFNSLFLMSVIGYAGRCYSFNVKKLKILKWDESKRSSETCPFLPANACNKLHWRLRIQLTYIWDFSEVSRSAGWWERKEPQTGQNRGYWPAAVAYKETDSLSSVK